MNTEEFNTLFEQHDYEKILFRIKDLDIEYLDKNKLALAYFHTEDYEESFKLFEKITNESNDPIDWFNLTSASIYANQEHIALEALEKALSLNNETRTDGKGIPPAFMLFISAQNMYNVGKYNLAFSLIDRLYTYYKDIKLTDHVTLDNNGIPHLDVFIQFLSKLLHKQTIEIDHKKWLTTWSGDLDENGRDLISQLDS